MSSFDPRRDFFDLRRETLAVVFSKINSETPLELIKEKNHVLFLEDYLGKDGLSATYVIAERGYINRDYLSDYSSYYSTCFPVYSKLCTRLHFFSSNDDPEKFLNKFSTSIVEGVKRNPNHLEFWNKCYLGYLVVKPTPSYFIGFTLLKHFNFNADKECFSTSREYWGIKDYKAHIYGNEVIIPSLAFQEQDKNVAACATIAIWSMLQRAAEDYYVILQSPSEITKGSGLVAQNGNRLIPNKGLSMLQMAEAITKNNLVTEVREIKSYKGTDPFNSYLKKLIHAYSRLKIPIILTLDLPPCKGDTEYDGHAVSISGYRMMALEKMLRARLLYRVFAKLTNTKVMLWKAECLDKIYVHDDQWGPFSRMAFSGKNKMKSSWGLIAEATKRSNCEGILIPLYPKVRISYDDIESRVIRLHKFFYDHFKGKTKGDFIWDIQLFMSEDFKFEIQQSDMLDDEDEVDKRIQFTFLTRSFPKYIWVATLQINQNQVLHFIYDATGLSGTNIIHTIFGYYPFINTVLFEKLNEYKKKFTSTEFTFIFDYNVQSYIEAFRLFKDVS